MKRISVRSACIFAFLFCMALLGAAAFLQFQLGIEPCPLCVIQRVLFLILTMLFFLAIFIPAHKFFHGFIFLISVLGSVVAGRQVWLQHLPAGQAPACGPGLDYMIKQLPLNETLHLLLYGSGECADVHWRFLSLSIAEWSLLCFIALAILALINFFAVSSDKHKR